MRRVLMRNVLTDERRHLVISDELGALIDDAHEPVAVGLWVVESK
jgi:hypothetical protein